MSVLASGGKVVRLNGKAIEAPQGGDLEPQVKNVTITENGASAVTPDAGKYLSRVGITVAVPSDAKEEQVKDVTITKNGTSAVEPDSGKVLSGVNVTVAVPSDQKPEQEKSVTLTANGTSSVTPDEGKVLSKVNVTVNVPSDVKEEEEKTVDITENGETVVEPSAGKALSKVTAKVNVPQGVPIQIDTPEGMNGLATAENVEKVYQYLGENTDVYTYGNLYQVSRIFGGNPHYELGEFEVPKVLGEKTITANGTYTASFLTDKVDGWNKVIVNVPSSGGGSLPADLYSTIKASGTAFDPQEVQFTLTAPSSASRLYLGIKAANGKTYCTTVEKFGGADAATGYNTDLSLFELDWDSNEAVNMTNGPIGVQYRDTATGEQLTVEGTEGYYLFV